MQCSLATQYNNDQAVDGTGECALCKDAHADCIECSGDSNKCTRCIAGKFLWDPTPGQGYTTCVACDQEGQFKYSVPTQPGNIYFYFILFIKLNSKKEKNIHSAYIFST